VLSVSEVASQLEISSGRVRQLIESGTLPAQKVGSQWVVNEVDLAAVSPRRNGRPLSSSAAWGVLWRALGRPVSWLSVREVSRANTRLKKGIGSLADQLSTRAARFEFRAHPSALTRLQGDSRWVAGGISAAGVVGADLIDGGSIVEGYLQLEDLSDFASEYGLVSKGSSVANVIVHAYSGLQPFGLGERSVPLLVVALDLLEHSDERTKRAGQELLNFFEGKAA
jgi:excisionase family DNA binding protein